MQIELADYDNKLKDFAEKNPWWIDLDDWVKVNYKNSWMQKLLQNSI